MNDGRRVIPFLVLVFLLFQSASAQLTRQWIARFSGNVKNGNNAAVAIAVDNAGNSIVTGWVTRTVSGIDIATIKYSPDGQQLWVSYYPPSSSAGTDKPTALAVDTANNIYVTGTTTTGTSSVDYVTMKLNPANGAIVWSKTYNGPGNGGDQPAAIVVDDSLHVYVTGSSLGSGTNLDYATIKYDSLGDSLWVQRYNGPANGADSALAMAVRASTDLYVTGASQDSGYDFLTIKYDAGTGDTVWTERYNGSGFGRDIPRSLVLRAANEVYVAGSSHTDTSGDDYLAIKYNASGVQQWVSRYDGPAHSDDEAYDMALNGSSTIFITGKSIQSGTFNDFVTIRINQNNGGGLRVDAYNGPANDEDIGVAILGGSKPYAVGSSAAFGVGKDFALIQYSAADAENFVERYDGRYHSDDLPGGIATDGAAIYVTGQSMKDRGSEFLTIKYVDPATVKYRTFTQDSLPEKSANLTSVSAVPNVGNVRDAAMAGAYPKIKKGFIGYPGGLVIGNARPDSASAFGWMRFDAGKPVAGMLPDTGVPRGFDTYGTVPFLGEKKNPTKSKYNNHLVGQLLTLRINIGASDAEVTPPTFGDLSYNDGDTSNHFNGLTLRQIAALADNYLTYWKRYPPVDWTHLDTIFTRVNRAFTGPFRWVSTNPLVVTGVNPVDSVPYLGPAIAPLMNPLAFPPSAIDLSPVKFALDQNYPNPFNPVTNISFTIPNDGFVTLKVYDILGREVATLLDRDLLAEGPSSFPFNGSNVASGVYFYRLVVEPAQDGGPGTGKIFTQVKKMLLLK